MPLVHTVMEGGSGAQYQQGVSPVRKTLRVAYKVAKADVVNTFTLEYVRDLLTLTKGNVSEAARISGLSRVALQKILARLGEKAAIFRAQGIS